MNRAKIISEIVKFQLKPGFEPAFSKLRQTVVADGGVKEQYHGLSHKKDHLAWVIQWPESSGPLQDPSFRDELKRLDMNESPVSWLVPFADASQPRRALVAPCAQLCTVPLKPGTDAGALATPLHKTYSDCYEAPGFTGGYWGTALNEPLKNWYYLGWETRAAHDAYAETALFWVEINNLAPYMSGGDSGYYTFTQQLSA
ncbi:hypothetical protein FB45DRAFT_100933 [Roridomyces roridus]|uniref:Uncharacterized protein n=1 Tax=Roridomyces roridus TaxID=1738132 RepID=A0AAD7BJM4_9AGAR|nr:hypothetical protein FB45DRAFT_100933 [Roridomyces roridus]